MRVLAVMLNGLDIIGYKLENDETEIRVSVQDFNKLVESGKIDGVSMLEPGVIKGLKLMDLPIDNSSKLTIIGKETDNGNVIGYTVKKADDNTEKSISIQKAWNLAAVGGILNAKAFLVTQQDGSVAKSLNVELE